MAFQQLTEEPLRRSAIASGLDEDVDDVAVWLGDSFVIGSLCHLPPQVDGAVRELILVEWDAPVARLTERAEGERLVIGQRAENDGAGLGRHRGRAGRRGLPRCSVISRSSRRAPPSDTGV